MQNYPRIGDVPKLFLPHKHCKGKGREMTNPEKYCPYALSKKEIKVERWSRGQYYHYHSSENVSAVIGRKRTIKVRMEDIKLLLFADDMMAYYWNSWELSGKLLEIKKRIPKIPWLQNLYQNH